MCLLVFFISKPRLKKNFFFNVPSLSGIQDLSSMLLRPGELEQSRREVQSGEAGREQSGVGCGGDAAGPCAAAATQGVPEAPTFCFIWTCGELSMPFFLT